MRTGLRRRRGFTLIETLVAFAIMALALGQLLRAISAGAQSERRADFLLRATADAQSQLAALGVSEPLVLGETSSSYDDGLLWTLDVARDRAVALAGGAPSVIAFRLRLDVRAPAGAGRLTFVAEKLTSPPPQTGVP